MEELKILIGFHDMEMTVREYISFSKSYSNQIKKCG